MSEKRVTVEDVVDGTWRDLRESWPTLTKQWLQEQADLILAGKAPQGSPGMILQKYLREFGFLA